MNHQYPGKSRRQPQFVVSSAYLVLMTCCGVLSQRGNRSVAVQALDRLIESSNDAQQQLTALRCLLKLRISFLDDVTSSAPETYGLFLIF